MSEIKVYLLVTLADKRRSPVECLLIPCLHEAAVMKMNRYGTLLYSLLWLRPFVFLPTGLNGCCKKTERMKQVGNPLD